MKEDIVKIGTRHVAEVRNINKDLIEKALHMRCLAYLANVKAGLLMQTIFKIDWRRKELRKQFEEHKLLHKTLIRQALIFDNTHDSIFITDMEGIVVDCNNATEIIFGNPKKEVIGNHFWSTYNHSEDSNQSESKFINSVLHDGYKKSEFNFKRMDGTSGVCEVTAVPLEFEGTNSPILLVIFNQDITEQKRAQIKLIEKSNEIEVANKEMGDFVYIVSHDLKEPLFAIGGYISRLSKMYMDIFDEKGKNHIDRIKANVEIMSTRISDIIGITKVGTVEYDFAENNTGDIVKDVINELENKIKRNKTEIIIPDSMPIILCDGEKLKNVFLNLISNAIKFMGDSGQRQVKIGYDKTGKYCKFFVEDMGIGIPEEHQRQIFKIFSRLKEIEVEGTGVGLAIVKKIIDIHKGKVWVESPVKDGRGTRFCFTIPISRNFV